MEDSEYYKMMRNQYSHRFVVKKSNYSKVSQWNKTQGSEDAQMLSEKETGWKASSNFDDAEEKAEE